MELNKMEELLDKYFEGNTNEQEEQELRIYFSQENIAEHLIPYKKMFVFFTTEQSIESKSEFKIENTVKKKNNKQFVWSVAASVLVAIGVGAFAYTNYFSTHSDDLGTFDNPEMALQETQKALTLLSKHVNTGYESVEYIEEYEFTKNKIFNLN